MTGIVPYTKVLPHLPCETSILNHMKLIGICNSYFPSDSLSTLL